MTARHRDRDPLDTRDSHRRPRRMVATFNRLALFGACGFALATSGCFDTSAPTSMTVSVRLDNQCEVFDDAFMAVSEPDNKQAFFRQGVAVLETRSDAQIMVRASSRYPDMQFVSPKYKAAPTLTITVNCGMGDRLERTLDSIRDQFRQR